MEDCIDRVGSANFVTKLDLLKGYWQVPLTPRASDISAFVTPDTFLQYTVMPFGLRNAPATFQRLMHRVLSGVENCEAYLDDVVAYSSTWSDHLHTLSLIFSRLREASLTLNLAKYEFGKATVTYLGKQVGQGHVRPLAEKVQAIIDFPVPQSKKALRRFLGMCGYYRGFCRIFSDVVAPLTGLVSPLKHFVWSPACQAAFESAKALLCSTPVLAAPNFTRAFKLEVDASACGAGAHHRVLRNFFWPGLKSDVVKYCRTCQTCQMVGKPNQPVPPAPLHPIPVLGEPFERVLIDCVGPLPRTKSGNQYILTVMCAATRYPEAIPLRTLKARPVVKALTKFFFNFRFAQNCSK